MNRVGLRHEQEDRRLGPQIEWLRAADKSWDPIVQSGVCPVVQDHEEEEDDRAWPRV